MKKVRSTEDMCRALHLRQSEIQRLLDLSYIEARQVFDKAKEKDIEELADRCLFDDKVRMSSVRWAIGYSKREFDEWIEKILKSGL